LAGAGAGMSGLPNSVKLGLLGVAVLVAVAVGWFGLIAPKRSEAARLQQQIDDTNAQIVLARATASHGHVPGIRVADLFELSRGMPDRANIPNVLLELSKIAADTGVTFQSITPHDPVPLGSYQQIGIDLVFQGHFYDLSDFLYRLRNLVDVRDGVLSASGRLFSVDSISFDEGDLQFPYVKAALTVSAYVFGDGTAAPIPVGATSAGQGSAATTAPATEGSQPIPAAPPNATAAGR
jgi:hypothetical protein